MPDVEDVKRHLLLDYILTYNNAILQALVTNPAAVLEGLHLPPDAMRCPPEVHRAVRRAEGAVREIEALGEADPVETLPAIADIVARHFATPYRVVKIPFGVRFEETLPQEGPPGMGDAANQDYTATATVVCTFSPGCGLDPDG